MLRRLALAVALIAAAAVVAVAEAGPVLGARTTNVTVTAGAPSEYSFTLSRKSVPKGPVFFFIVNQGQFPHDFTIAGKVTPVVSPGQTATLEVVLRPGRYPYRCTFLGHAQAGMHGVLRVRA
jgi:uncharacterized cupredoxin-like copper-binding protein